MKKKTKEQKTVIRNHGYKPFMWEVIVDQERYLIVRNWLTLRYMCLYK